MHRLGLIHHEKKIPQTSMIRDLNFVSNPVKPNVLLLTTQKVPRQLGLWTQSGRPYSAQLAERFVFVQRRKVPSLKMPLSLNHVLRLEYICSPLEAWTFYRSTLVGWSSRASLSSLGVRVSSIIKMAFLFRTRCCRHGYLNQVIAQLNIDRIQLFVRLSMYVELGTPPLSLSKPPSESSFQLDEEIYLLS